MSVQDKYCGPNTRFDYVQTRSKDAPSVRNHGIFRRCTRLAAKAVSWNIKKELLARVIPEIEIWRAANLMLKRHRGNAHMESAARADELAAGGDHNGAAVWHRITDAVDQFANEIPPGPVHDLTALRKRRHPLSLPLDLTYDNVEGSMMFNVEGSMMFDDARGRSNSLERGTS